MYFFRLWHYPTHESELSKKYWSHYLIISLSHLFSDFDLAHITGDAEREDACVQGRGPQGSRAPRRLLQVCPHFYINSYTVSVCFLRNQLSNVCVSVVCLSIPNICFCRCLSVSVSVPVSLWSYGCVLCIYVYIREAVKNYLADFFR